MNPSLHILTRSVRRANRTESIWSPLQTSFCVSITQEPNLPLSTLEVAMRILRCEFTENSESPFWIFCMLTTWLRYNLARWSTPVLCLNYLDRRKIFTMRWSFCHTNFLRPIFLDFIHFWTWLLLAGLSFYLNHFWSTKTSKIIFGALVVALNFSSNPKCKKGNHQTPDSESGPWESHPCRVLRQLRREVSLAL